MYFVVAVTMTRQLRSSFTVGKDRGLVRWIVPIFCVIIVHLVLLVIGIPRVYG